MRMSPHERRAQIMAEARVLIAANGYESVTLEMILESLKLSKGGFYHHFKSVEALLSALVEEDLHRLVEKLSQDCEMQYKEAVLNLFISGSDLLEGDKGVLAHLKSRAARLRYLEILESVFYRPLKELLRQILDRAISSGEICQQGFDPGALCELFEAINRHANRKSILGEWDNRQAFGFLQLSFEIAGQQLEMSDEFNRLARRMFD